MSVEPMTDEDPNMIDLRRFLAEHVGRQGSFRLDVAEGAALIARLDAERARADAAEAERDAALARAVPEPVLVRTVEEVEALPGGHFYLVRRPWDARAMPWACLAVGSHKRLWRMLGSTVRSGCGALVGALISGPLPDLPTPTAADEATDAP